MSTNGSTTLLPPAVAGEPLNLEQSTYLDGFFSGLSDRGVSFGDVMPGAGPAPAAEKKKKIIPEEKIKNDLHPFDALPELNRKAKENVAPEKEDIFRFKWNGLFWLAPVHEGYMCRLRIPGGFVNSHQVRELANISDDIASGYLQITTRNNFQVRVVQPKDTPELLRRIQDCGLHSRGSGADNLRNFTCNPTTGFDPYELIDVGPMIKELAYRVVNQLEYYDLPRKFNISFDGGGLIGVAEDTNDIGMRAVKIGDEIWFRILLGGVTGHEEFAEDCGFRCKAEDAVDVALAMTSVYIKNGNRSNRGKSRLIYLLKDWGMEKFVAETEALLGYSLEKFDESEITPHEKPDEPHPQVGVYPQKQEGLNYIGITVPVGILQSEEARSVAEIAEKFGNGEMRLTIFENLIIPNIPDENLKAAKAAIVEAGLNYEASFVRGGAAACTGNQYCKFASSDTKTHTMELVDFLEKNITLDSPINIHTTGCPHSCAQHYIGDLGLLACKVQVEGNDEPVEGYHVFVGGGFGANKRLGRQLFKSVAAGDELNQKVLSVLTAYLDNRTPGERFVDFTSRHEIEVLSKMVEPTLTTA